MTHSHAARTAVGRAEDPVAGLPVDPVQAILIGVGLAGLAWFASARQGSSSGRERARRTSGDWRRMAPYDEADRFYRRRAGRRGAALDPGNAEEASFGEAGFGETAYPGHGGYETAAALVSEPSQGHAASSTAARPRGTRFRRPRRGMPKGLLMGAAAAVLGVTIGLALQQGAFDSECLAGPGPQVG